MNSKPISDAKRNTGCARIGMALFGLIFLGAGLAALWFIAIHPMLRWNQAKQWSETNCKILSSKIVVDHSDDGSSYDPEITYEYTVDRKKHVNDQVDFKISGSEKRAKEMTQRFPKNVETICYYDPENPADSVLVRSSPLSFWILFPFPFILVGGVVLFFAIFGKIERRNTPFRKRPRPGQEFSEQIFEADEKDKRWDQPQKLIQETTKLQRLLVAGFIALFWNGIVSVFVGGLISGEFGGGGQTICFTLFLTPFVLVGLGLIIYVVHTLLSMFNPKVEIAMSSGAVPLGGTVDIAWEFSGNVNRIRQLQISITGTESATYVRGTSTYTDNEVFCKLLALDSGSPDEMAFGNQTIEIPIASMHTFEADNNQINWTVEVHGEIPFWPDVKESFPFRVKPVS